MYLFNFNQSQNSNHVPILKASLLSVIWNCIMHYEIWRFCTLLLYYYYYYYNK